MPQQAKDSISVTAKIDTPLLKELDTYVDHKKREKHGRFNRTDAINEVVALGLQAAKNPKAMEVGIILLRHVAKLDDPLWVADLKKRLDEITLVDYVSSLNKDQLDALATVVFDELRLKAGKAPFSLMSPQQKRDLLQK